MNKLITQKRYCSHCKEFTMHYKHSYGWVCSKCRTYKKETKTG